MLKFHVGALLHKPPGSKEEFKITESLHFHEGDVLKLIKPVTGRVQFLKLPHEINVQIVNLRTVVECHCGRCLAAFECSLDIPLTSREFIIDVQERDLGEDEVVSYVNKNTNEIELDDMIREELLLHFHAVPLCSEGCKGLCDQCGVNRNEKTCSCVPTESKNTPFKFPH